MRNLKAFVTIAALAILVICVYSFLLGNGVFKGEFTNDAIGWYFLAKGIFCSLALYLLVCLLESVSRERK